MSYILDALKRADAERARGAVPGLHAQPMTSADHPERRVSQQLTWWLAGAAVVIAAAAWGLWHWQATPLAAATPVMASTVVASAATPAPVIEPVVTTPSAPPVAVAPTAPLVPPAVQATAQPAVKTPVAAGQPAAVPVVESPAPPVPVPAPAVAHAPLAPLIDELPENLRQQLPALNITGAVYAAAPAQRLLLINNLVLPQGSQVATGVTLEEIQPHSAVFNFHDTRFRMKY